MGGILSHPYQPRTAADQFFCEAYPGYHLMSYDGNATKQELVLNLLPNDAPVCPKCGRRCSKIHATLQRQVRCAPHYGFEKVFIHLPVRRVRCAHCKSRAMEVIPWICWRSRLTNRMISQVQLRARGGATNACIARELKLSWDTVKRLDKIQLEHVFCEVDFHNVKHLMIDEFALQKGHRYATIVMDADTHRALWICKGKSGADVKTFFEMLQQKGVAHRIESIAMDMNACFPSLVAQYLPKAKVLYDGFHALQLFTRDVLLAAKKVCQQRVQQECADNKNERKSRQAVLKGSQWVLVRRPETLDNDDRQKLESLQRDNALLAALYPMAELVRHLWRCKVPQEACRQLHHIRSLCLAVARQFDFEPARTFAKTLKRRAQGIIYVGQFGYSSCPLEGANNKIKVIKRTAYGYRDFEYFKLKIFAALPGKRASPFEGLTQSHVVLKNGVFPCCFHTHS